MTWRAIALCSFWVVAMTSWIFEGPGPVALVSAVENLPLDPLYTVLPVTRPDGPSGPSGMSHSNVHVPGK